MATALAALGIADLDTILSREGMFKDPAPEKKGNSKKGKKDSAKKKK